ncbi:MAG: SGNH/GDSL hydrolase family protein [Magnetococcales bacterium]|nr:SGNH/GDSL hydrolase family protein [Magnetococcales bacterium]
MSETFSYFVIQRYSNTTGNPYHPYLGWTVKTNAVRNSGTHCQHLETLSTGKISTDEEGRSITPLSYDNPDVKLVITGGSTMFGIGSTDNATTASSLLEKIIFEKKGLKAEVYNLGVSGYQSFNEMLTLHRFFKYQDADFVLAISGRNDSQYAFDEQDIRSASLINSVWDKARIINQLEERHNPVYVGLRLVGLYLRSYSYSVQLLDKTIHLIRLKYASIGQHESLKGSILKDAAQQRSDLFDNIPKRAEITSQNYSMMNTLSNENNAKFLMLLQPTTFTKKHLTNEEVKCSESRVHGPDRMSNKVLKIYESEFYKYFKTIKKSYIYHDHSEIMNNEKETAYIDMAHYNDLGALRVAQSAYGVLEPMLNDFIKNKR